MFENGWTTASNKLKTKSYKITNLTPERFDIKIGTYAVWMIGGIHRWHYQYLTIEYKNKKARCANPTKGSAPFL